MTRSEFISFLKQDGFTYCFGNIYVKEVGTEFHDGFIHTTFEVDEDVAVRRVIRHTWQPATNRLMESVSESLIRYHYTHVYTINDYHRYIYPEDMDTAVEGN